MNWLDKLERRFGFLAIPNAIPAIVGLQAAATLLAMKRPDIVGLMLLDPVAIAQGQYWRLITFIFVPSTSPMSLVFAIFWFYFLWLMGQALEHQWGHFKLTVYLVSGLLFQVLVSVLSYHLGGVITVESGYYWTLSLQLAFAYLYPDFTIYLFMILPIKMRWWSWFIGAVMIFQAVQGGVPALLMISAALGNYLLFFGPDYWLHWRLRHQTEAQRSSMQASFKKAIAAMPSKLCGECGKDTLEADLRLCTCDRCGEDGKFWCTDHLKGHLDKN